MPLLFLASLVLAAAAWLWGPPLWARWRRARVVRQPFPAAWREILRQRMPYFRRLPPDLQLQLKKHIQILIAEKPFIGCNGLQVSDEMRVLVAAQAALLLLNRGAGYFRGLHQILLYPGPVVVDRPVNVGGVTQEARRVLAGESWQQGQVILSWDDVLAGAADPADGQNVVIHEFAHRLVQETGSANGAPWLGRRERYARWSSVLGAAYARLHQQLAEGAEPLVDPYGATDPAEFFAVVSEVFFEQPARLAAADAALYHELVAYYRVDPQAW